MEDRPVGALASLLQASLNEAALAIVHATDPLAVQDEVSTAFRSLVLGLRRAA